MAKIPVPSIHLYLVMESHPQVIPVPYKIIKVKAKRKRVYKIATACDTNYVTAKNNTSWHVMLKLWSVNVTWI